MMNRRTRFLRAMVVLLLCCGALVGARAQNGGTWQTLAPMPSFRQELASAVLDGKVYVMGGLSWENVALKTVEEFDPKTNAWRPMADMPTARFILTAESTAGQVFAIGGAATDFTTQSAVEALRP